MSKSKYVAYVSTYTMVIIMVLRYMMSIWQMVD